MNDVVGYYENYREENRLTTNNARKIELITTMHMLDSVIGENKTILDCAAGTGIYESVKKRRIVNNRLYT